jgi:hypothetical protein
MQKVVMSFLPVSNLMVAASDRNPVRPNSICSGRTDTFKHISMLYMTRIQTMLLELGH